MRKSLLSAAIAVSLFDPSVRAQFVVSDPPLQAVTMAMQAKQLMQYIQEAQTALQAVQMAQLMARAGVNLIQHPSTNIAADIGQFTSILAASQGLAKNFASMDVSFQTQYANYTPNPLLNFATQYNTWATTTMKTLSGTLGAAGYQANSLNNDQLFLARVQMQTQSPQGEMEALQLGNTIGTQTVAQLMQLRALMIADMSAKAAVAGQQAAAQTQAQTANQTAFTHADWKADPKIW